MERPRNEGKQHQPQSRRYQYLHNKAVQLKIVQVYASTTSYSVEDINSFYNDVGETLGKPNHNTIVMGDCNAQIGKRTNVMQQYKHGDIESRRRYHLEDTC